MAYIKLEQTHASHTLAFKYLAKHNFCSAREAAHQIFFHKTNFPMKEKTDAEAAASTPVPFAISLYGLFRNHNL